MPMATSHVLAQLQIDSVDDDDDDQVTGGAAGQSHPRLSPNAPAVLLPAPPPRALLSVRCCWRRPLLPCKS